MSGVCSIIGAICMTGIATVHDGDTLKIGRQAFRLAGVDAEELTEPHGYTARMALIKIIGAMPVRCESSGERSYNRVVAQCYVGDVELNRAIIAGGHALDCARYSGGRYRDAEPNGARAALIQKPYCTRTRR